tara:strand:+ start:6522 stop:6707 length:186 start_codon:yes stop_codon:yes gene_type:complete
MLESLIICALIGVITLWLLPKLTKSDFKKWQWVFWASVFIYFMIRQMLFQIYKDEIIQQLL